MGGVTAVQKYIVIFQRGGNNRDTHAALCRDESQIEPILKDWGVDTNDFGKWLSYWNSVPDGQMEDKVCTEYDTMVFESFFNMPAYGEKIDTYKTHIVIYIATVQQIQENFKKQCLALSISQAHINVSNIPISDEVYPYTQCMPMWTATDWIRDIQRQFPGTREDVLKFIYDIVFHSGEVQTDAISELFSSGYCYYFALMLKSAFGGQVMWHKYHGHIVWLDTTTDICYDVNGVFVDAGEEDIVPVEILGDIGLESFLHRGNDTKYSTDEVQSYVQPRVNEYEKKMGWTITRNPYYKSIIHQRKEQTEQTNLF